MSLYRASPQGTSSFRSPHKLSYSRHWQPPLRSSAGQEERLECSRSLCPASSILLYRMPNAGEAGTVCVRPASENLHISGHGGSLNRLNQSAHIKNFRERAPPARQLSATIS